MTISTRPGTTTWRYGSVAIALHWVLAALIVGMLALGWFMMTIEKQPQGPWYFDLHRSVGLVVFALVLLRILWRFAHRPEALPSSVMRWQVTLSWFTQYLLYACMVVMPVTGFLGSAYSKAGVRFFGLALPAWATPSDATAEWFFSVHSTTVWILVALVVLHVAGGLKHLVVDRDGVFQRMWI